MAHVGNANIRQARLYEEEKTSIRKKERFLDHCQYSLQLLNDFFPPFSILLFSLTCAFTENEIKETASDIERLRHALEEARQIRKNRLEYEAKGLEVMKVASRQQSER